MHLMLDIETLSQSPQAAVISIGACTFDKSGIQDTFKVNLKPKSAEALGMIINKDTVLWWSKQSPEAQLAALTKNVEAIFGLQEFSDWCKGKGIKYFWAHGVTFDMVIMENALKLAEVNCPWKFWQIMDTRTVFGLFGIKTKSIHATYGSTHHDATEDAKTQTKALIAILNSLGWQDPDGPLAI